MHCDQTPDKQMIVEVTPGSGHERRYQYFKYADREFGFIKKLGQSVNFT
jgi:hypothetical protein